MSMNSKISWSLAGLGGVILLAIVFGLGMKIGMNYISGQVDSELNSVQVMLAFNRILDGRQIESLLSRGCSAQALEKTKIAIDQDTKLIASLYKGRLNQKAGTYITNRDPDFLHKLGEFKSKYGDSWQEPECKK